MRSWGDMRGPSADLEDWLQARQQTRGTHNPDIPADPCEYAEGIPLRFSRSPFTFEGREWLKQIMRDPAPVVCIEKARQVGWSVMLAVLITWYALRYPGIHIMYCTMRQEQFRFFAQQRIRPMLRGIGIKTGKDEDRIKSMQLDNGTLTTLVSGHDDFAQALGYPVDVLLLDEAEKLPIRALGAITETMHASPIKKMFIGGTGTIIGYPWAEYKRQANIRKWDAHKQRWNEEKASPVSGYYVSQRMLPGWTAEAEEAKRTAPGMTTARYETEILGIDTALADTPLPEYVVRKCLDQTRTAWNEPAAGRPPGTVELLATVDLAAGGEASDTVINITAIKSDSTFDILDALRSSKRRHTDIYADISPVITRWQPDRVISDAGGNEPLLDMLMEGHNALPYRFGSTGSPDVHVKYDPPKPPLISKSHFTGAAIERWHAGRITAPDTGEKWVIDQLTAVTQEESTSRTGSESVIYAKIPGRKNDMLMANVLAEAANFTRTDPRNPANFKGRVAARTSPDLPTW